MRIQAGWAWYIIKVNILNLPSSLFSKRLFSHRLFGKRLFP